MAMTTKLEFRSTPTRVSILSIGIDNRLVYYPHCLLLLADICLFNLFVLFLSIKNKIIAKLITLSNHGLLCTTVS